MLDFSRPSPPPKHLISYSFNFASVCNEAGLEKSLGTRSTRVSDPTNSTLTLSILAIVSKVLLLERCSYETNILDIGVR